jgi:hypothetical protein
LFIDPCPLNGSIGFEPAFVAVLGELAIGPDATALQRGKLSRLQGFAAMSKKKQVPPFWAESADSFEKPSQR